MEATELARPTTIPTFTCPRFGIGLLEYLPGMMLLLPPFIIIMPLPISVSLLISEEKALGFGSKRRRCFASLSCTGLFVLCEIVLWRLIYIGLRLTKRPLFWAEIKGVAIGFGLLWRFWPCLAALFFLLPVDNIGFFPPLFLVRLPTSTNWRKLWCQDSGMVRIRRC